MYLCQSITKKSFDTLFSINKVCDLCFGIDFILIGYQKVYIIYAENELDVICQIATYMYYQSMNSNILFTYDADFLGNIHISTYLDFDTEKVFIVGENSSDCRNMSIKKY